MVGGPLAIAIVAGCLVTRSWPGQRWLWISLMVTFLFPAGLLALVLALVAKFASCGIATKQIRKVRKENGQQYRFDSESRRSDGEQREKTVTGRVLHDPVKDKLRADVSAGLVEMPHRG